MALRWIHELIPSVLFELLFPVFEGKNNFVIKLIDTSLLGIVYSLERTWLRIKGPEIPRFWQ